MDNNRALELITTDPYGKRTTVDNSSRISYAMQRSVGLMPGLCEVAIYEPPPAVEGALRNATEGILTAKGSKNALLFSGQVIASQVQRMDTQRVLVLTLADGDSFLRGRVSFSLARNSSLAEYARALILRSSHPAALGTIPKSLEDIRFPRGVSAHGKAAERLKQLAASTNCACFIQHGAFYMVPNALPYDAPVTIIANEDIVGDVALTDIGIAVDTRAVSLILGSRIRLDADTAKGIYRVYMIEGAGDTRQGEWRVTLHAMDESKVLAQNTAVWR